MRVVSFSYSFPWYSWEQWEKLLDWAALRGINLNLAWVGHEKIVLDRFRDIGLTDDEPSHFSAVPKAWSGLTQTYYRQRWSIFVCALRNATQTGSLNEAAMNGDIKTFEKSWQYKASRLRRLNL